MMSRAFMPFFHLAIAAALYWGASASCRADEIPKDAADRFGRAVAEILNSGSEPGFALLNGLATKRAEVLDEGDAFWVSISTGLLARQDAQTALVAYVGHLTPTDRARLIPLTRQLPEVADVLAVVPAYEAGKQQPIEDEVLRRMEHPNLAAQRALIARATDPTYARSDELVERIASAPSLIEDGKDDVEAMRTDGDPKRFSLFFRYAAARSIPLKLTEIGRALDLPNPKVQKAALVVLANDQTDAAKQMAVRLRTLVGKSTDGDVMSLAVELLARSTPNAAAEELSSRASKDGFWRSDLGIRAFAALTRTPEGLDTVVKGTAQVSGGDISEYGDCRVLPGSLALVTRESDTKSIPADLFAIIEAVLRKGKASECDVDANAKSFDEVIERLRIMGVLERDIASEFYDFLKQPLTATPELNSKEIKALSDIFGKSHATRSALMFDQKRLSDIVLDPKVPLHPIVGALILSLPSDHEFLSKLRESLSPPAGDSLIDYVRTHNDVLVRVLVTTARDQGYSAKDLDEILAIADASDTPDLEAASFDVLRRAGGAERLLAYFDHRAFSSTPLKSAAETIRALRAFAASVGALQDPTSAYTASRLAWLMQHITDEGLRGRVVRAMGRRPAGMPFEDTPFSTVIGQATTLRNGKGAVGSCLDLATFGPYPSLRIGLTVLESSEGQNYEGEPWPSVCMHLLAPSDRSALSDTGRTLTSFVDRAATGAAVSTEPTARLTSLSKIWDEASERPLGNFDQRRVAEAVVSIAPELGWGLDDFTKLRDWDEKLRANFPDQASAVRNQWLKRGALIAAMALPGGIAAHLVFWLLLVVAYPRSVRLQTHVFYNPWARKILGFGYVDLLLVWIGPIRRRLFEPFRDALAGELERVGSGSAFGAYFPKSEILRVTRTDLEREIRNAERAALTGTLPRTEGAVVDALAKWSGPTWLFGPSGRGKSSYLRYALTANAHVRFPFIYLKASECGEDLLTAICNRLGGLGQDRDLVGSLVHSGMFDIYVDGLNEVDRERQEVVVRFIVDHRSANVFVASQEVGISLPSKLSTFYLLPLTRNQMKEFLASRATGLGESAPVRGDVFLAKTSLFIDELAEEASPHEDAAPSDAETRRRRELAANFIATLANPIDLETAASLLSLDIEPDPLRLQEQQFGLVSQDYESRLGRPFPITALSKSVLAARQESRLELEPNAFDTAIAILEERKQVKRVSVASVGGGSVAEYRFRHDKIRDFYTHFAFLDDVDARFSLARDDRFSGVYDYLARKLPAAAAADLREYLLSAAIDSNDHRLSDRFLQHLRWRTLLDESDPPWLSEYQPQTARTALVEFEKLAGKRREVETEMRGLRIAIDAERVPTRVLSARTVEGLESSVENLLEKMGAKIQPTPGGAASIIDPPGHLRFSLFCMAGNNVCTGVAAVGVRARLLKSPGHKLLVINQAPDDEPKGRDWQRVSEWAKDLGVDDLEAIGTLEFYQLATSALSQHDPGAFWRRLTNFGRPAEAPTRGRSHKNKGRDK